MPSLNRAQPTAVAAPRQGEAPPLDLSHQHELEAILPDEALKPGTEPAFDASTLRLLAVIDPVHTAAICFKLLASKTGRLPDGFNNWALVDKSGRTVAHVAASRGRLPQDFDQWGLTNWEGKTVAHVAAGWDHLPKGFSQWGLLDKDGRTVAHVAAAHGRLPKGFTQWGLVDKDGWTVAHEAAKHHRLPRDFNQWGLADRDGQTVASYAIWAGEARRDPTEGSRDDL